MNAHRREQGHFEFCRRGGCTTSYHVWICGGQDGDGNRREDLAGSVSWKRGPARGWVWLFPNLPLPASHIPAALLHTPQWGRRSPGHWSWDVLPEASRMRASPPRPLKGVERERRSTKTVTDVYLCWNISFFLSYKFSSDYQRHGGTVKYPFLWFWKDREDRADGWLTSCVQSCWAACDTQSPHTYPCTQPTSTPTHPLEERMCVSVICFTDTESRHQLVKL